MEQKYIREVTRVGKRSLSVVIPSEIVAELKIREKQKACPVVSASLYYWGRNQKSPRRHVDQRLEEINRITYRHF